MNSKETSSWSAKIVESIAHAHRAHAEYPKSPDDMVRFHDRETPYVVHPIWCAATILQEPSLPLELRRTGYQALLWHDTLEDTTLDLPPGIPDVVAKLVEGMTFSSFQEEQEKLWVRSAEIKLLKLYDKVSNLLDGAWMKDEKWNIYVQHTLCLATEVEGHFGTLNIIRIARAIALPRE